MELLQEITCGLADQNVYCDKDNDDDDDNQMLYVYDNDDGDNNPTEQVAGLLQ